MNTFIVRKLTVAPVMRACSLRPAQHLSTWTATQDAAKVGTSHAEGDVWDHNYSLTEDGVVNSKLAFRNAKASTVLNNLPAKAVGGKVDLKDINYTGKYDLVEAGDNLDHDKFEDVLEEQHDYLSTDKILFFEDFGLGAAASSRVGARMISENPAHALIFRALMIPTPPRPTDHRARYNGWNLDARWEVAEYNWTGTEYDFVREQVSPQRGERPVIAFLGGASKDTVALQFAQQTGKAEGIAGANIVAGGNASVRGVVEAYGQAAAAMLNEEGEQSVTLPSVTSAKGGKTTLFAGNFSDGFVNKVNAKGSLYGAYYNTLSAGGVSAVFGGFIGPAKSVPAPTAAAFTAQTSPVVVSGDVSTVSLSPDNSVPSPTSVVFVDSSVSSISLDAAASRLAESCGDEAKAEAAKALLGGAKLIVVKSEKDAEAYIL